MIEVKAQLSFDQFRQGKFYQVDECCQRVQAQIHAGYFEVVPVPGTDMASVDAVADAAGDLGAGVSGPKTRKRGPGKKVTDGQGDHLSAEGDSIFTPGDLAARLQDG